MLRQVTIIFISEIFTVSWSNIKRYICYEKLRLLRCEKLRFKHRRPKNLGKFRALQARAAAYCLHYIIYIKSQIKYCTRGWLHKTLNHCFVVK